VLLTTESSGQLWSVCAWDIQTGASVRTFKGGTVQEGSLCVLAGRTLIGASLAKPVLQLWSLLKKEDVQQKIVCPGRVSAICVSPDGLHCVASIAEKLYVWEMCAGNLLAVLDGHYLEVRKIRFTDDSNFFVTGSEDGIVTVWSLAVVVSRTRRRAAGPRPRHTWMGHPLPVTDIHVGCGGSRARVVSSSIDRTCKMWDMESGEQIQTFVYEEAVHSVIMDRPELRLLAGLSSGIICCTPLFAQQMEREQHISTKSTHPDQTIFRGHSDAVLSLAVSYDGSLLVSGSRDSTVRVWNLFSGTPRCTLDHTGSVTNVLLTMLSPGQPSAAHHPPVPNFKQQPVTEEGASASRVFNMNLPEASDPEWLSPAFASPFDMPEHGMFTTPNQEDEEQDNSQDISGLQKEVSHLKQVNQEMYSFLTSKIVT
ncbi:hypothetical protein BaRGS_00015824, partial [Batillaria attramentaria]